MKKGIGLPYINWSEDRTALLMSSRKGETSQYRYMKYDVTD